MNVLIKGMDKIPEDGAVLVVKHDDDGKAYIKYAGVMGYSMELVELPEKYGDLIDGQKVLEDNKHLEYPTNRKYRTDRVWIIGFNRCICRCSD